MNDAVWLLGDALEKVGYACILLGCIKFFSYKPKPKSQAKELPSTRRTLSEK